MTSPGGAAEILWARGSASDHPTGRYAEADCWDHGTVPAGSDRARVDRGGTVMTIDSEVTAQDFLFGVNEPGQRFEFTPDADVRLSRNFFVAFNRGDVTVNIAPEARLSIGASMILGQEDNPGHDDEDVTVNVSGDVEVNGGIIFGLRYNGDVSNVDLLLVVRGTVRADNVLIANEEAQGADRNAFLSPAKNNSARIEVAPAGTLTLIGDKRARADDLVAEGVLVAHDPYSTLSISYDGRDTQITATASEPE